MSGEGGIPFSVNAALGGLAVYLDNFAIMDLAEGDRERRERFLASIHSGAELLLSVSNVVDLSGPQGASLDATRRFLDEIGPHWFPVELDPNLVIRKEENGVGPAMNCLSERFLRDFIANRIRAREGQIVNLSADFFRLGGILEWIAPQRESLRAGMQSLDEALSRRIEGYVERARSNPEWLDNAFPATPDNPARPATFAYQNLVRNLVTETSAGRRIRRGDGLDFCHAVVACGCASVAMLDTEWKRRVSLLPKPNNAPPIYSGPELDRLVSDLYCNTVLNPRNARGAGL